MRSAATWTVVGALAAIALFAAVDALRGEPRPAAPAPPERTAGARADGPPRIEDRAAVRAELAEAGVTGALYLTDKRCRPWVLELPALAWRSSRSGRAADCRFVLAPDGRRALFGDAVWHPSADLGAVDQSSLEEGAVIEVSSETGDWAFRFTGAKPAFRPDGTLTFVRDGELWEWADACAGDAETAVFRAATSERRCARRVLARAALQRAFRGRWPFPRLKGREIREAVWLDERRAVVLVEGDSGAQVLAVLADGRLLASIGAFGAGVRDLEASPRGTHVAARFHGEVQILDERLASRPVGSGRLRGVAWSPDERFTVFATDSSVLVRPPGSPRGPLIDIPIAVADLAWGP